MKDKITVVIPTSPIPSHPSTSGIDLTIRSIRHHLPDVQILISIDGVRPEQEKFRERYQHYIDALNFAYTRLHYGSCSIYQYTEFLHQAAMLKDMIRFIDTPYIFYVEHDLPLLPDPIDFHAITAALAEYVSCVRLHFWSHILPEHQHLMLDKEPIYPRGCPLIRTIQWSQHPHIITTDIYKKILDQFSTNARTMIETHAYGLVSTAPWDVYRCAIYAPAPNMKRFWHSHGREQEPKWEESFTF